MNSESQVIFGIPFFHFKVENWKESKESIQNLFDDYNSFTDYYDFYRLRLPKYSDEILTILKPSLQKFAEILHPHPVMITEMWYQKSKQYDYHQVHNHGGSGYSAIFYIKFNHKVHEPTVFYSPYGDPIRGSIHEWKPKVKEGDLIIFPSSLLHEGRVNMAQDERLIVSFNIGSFQEVRSINDNNWEKTNV